MPRRPSKRAASGGRPSRADSLRLRERILVTAMELFLAEGYGSTSIEAVAARARVSKRTLYDRFEDKAALFTAVVQQVMERIRPPPEVPLVEGATLGEMLRRIAQLILRAALSPQGLALHRLVQAESARFPELARLVAEDPTNREAINLIANLLASELPEAGLDGEEREFAAEQFIFMVVTVPLRHATGYGKPMTTGELDAWARRTVALFIDGCRGLHA
jgi:TetR/AcrR family transcriptional repressor of mexJK operon